MKYLIYFVIGGEPDYVQLLSFCINTIRNYTDNCVFDILVMCDKNYFQYIKNLPVDHFHITDDNKTIDRVSTRKVEIFSFEKIEDYDKVLYLDCDIVIAGNLLNIMENVIADDKLYVCKDKVGDECKISDHFSSFFSRIDRPYTEKDIEFFEQNKIYPFNAGQFAFCRTEIMKQHFENISSELNTTYKSDKHFYEQVFLNEYFNRRNAIDNMLTEYCYLCHIGNIITTKNIINHFLNCAAHYKNKLIYMRESHQHFCKQPVLIDNRKEFHTVLNIPEKSTIAEIGVFKGEYAEYLLETFNPYKLILIDPWKNEMICSGDQDGNNVNYYNGSDLYNHVLDKFKKNENVIILRKTSDNAFIETRTLDMVYIDGDHSYEGVRCDLELAAQWVKKGGWICGHDYCMNANKTQNNYDFGVKKAVDEFCYIHGYCISYLACDGCVSYAIRK